MKITPLDAAVLMRAAIKAAEEKDVGWLDADRPLSKLRMRLNEKIEVPQELVESALSCLVELNALKKWDHPDGITAEGFIQKIAPWGTSYDVRSGLFEKKAGK